MMMIEEALGTMKIYEAKKELCKICNERDSTLLPICVIDCKRQWYPVCIQCKDKIPYPDLRVITVLGDIFITHKQIVVQTN